MICETNQKQAYRTVLIIAGSDSIGGAGIQADIKTCTALRTYAMTAITAVTAQNTLGVRSYRAVDADLLRGQLQAVIEDVRPDAVKIGMLPTVESVRIVADCLRVNSLENIVVDPVCVATSGDALAADSVPAAIRDCLFPPATLVTPNVPEAELLSGVKIADEPSKRRAAEAMLDCGAAAVIIKGGHPVGDTRDMAVDTLYRNHPHEERVYRAPFVDTANTHGTGCTFSSAIAAGLAKGLTLDLAIQYAKNYLTEAIRAGADDSRWHGHGPMCHFYNVPEIQ